MVAVIGRAHVHQVPGAVLLLLQGPLGQITGPVGSEGQTVAGGRGGQELAVQLKGVDPVGGVDRHNGHVLGGLQFVVRRGHGGAGQLAAAGGAGHGHAAGGVIDRQRAAVGGSCRQLVQRTVLCGGGAVELKLVGGVVGLHAVGGEDAVVVLQSLVVVAVIGRAHVHQVPGAVLLLLQGPLGQITGPVGSEGQTVAGGRGGQELAVQLKGVDPVGGVDRHNGHVLGGLQFVVRRGHGGAGQLAAAGGAGHGHAAGGMIDRQRAAVGRRGGELVQHGGFGGLLGLRGGGLTAQLPEAHRLTGNVVVDAFVAAPVLPVVDAQIAGGPVGIGGSQVLVRHAPGGLGGADPHAVVIGGEIQVPVGTGDGESRVGLGQGPAGVCGCPGGGQGIPLHSGGHRQGLALAARAGGGQHPGGAVLRHGDGYGVVFRDICQLGFRPCGRGGVLGPDAHRQHGYHHDQAEQQGEKFASLAFSHMVPSFAWPPRGVHKNTV